MKNILFFVLSCLIVLIALATNGCATMAPGAAQIRVTRDASSVASCKIVGPVNTGVVVSSTVHDLKYALQNVALTTGADTVLITSSRLNNWTKQGIGYRCAL